MKLPRMTPETFCILLLLALSAFVALACAGCKSAGTAVRIEQRRVVGVTSAQIAEYTIPVISIGEGPSVSTYQCKETGSLVTVKGCAATTNETSVLWGMYESRERKALDFDGTFQVAPTSTGAVAE